MKRTQDHKPREKVFNAKATKLNYLDWGPSSADPLVMLHGGAWSWQEYLSLIPSLAQKWHVYALDFRGNGRSGWVRDRYRLKDFVEDNAQFLGRLKGRAVLVGHSLGGVVALILAARCADKVKALILEDALVTLETYRKIVQSSRDMFGVWLGFEAGQRIRLVPGSSGLLNSGTPGDIYEYIGPDTVATYDSSNATPVALAVGDTVRAGSVIYRFNGENYQYTTTSTSVDLEPNQIVLIRDTHTAGGVAGTAYKYIGTSTLENQNLSAEDFTADPNKWQPVTRDLTTEDYSSADWSENVINLSEQNYRNLGVDEGSELWSPVTEPLSQNILVDAQSTSSIESLVGAISGAVGGGTVGVAGSVGASFGRNLIGHWITTFSRPRPQASSPGSSRVTGSCWCPERYSSLSGPNHQMKTPTIRKMAFGARTSITMR